MSKADRPVRLDRRLVREHFASTDEEARLLISSGLVLVEGRAVDSPDCQVKPTASVKVIGQSSQWVSRGAYKLLTALDAFNIDLTGAVCLDVGASTGGFTHVMLTRGASRVYALDVGYGQLAWSLRQDQRVTVMDRRNAREMVPEWFEAPPSFAATDASFISLTALLEPMCGVLPDGGRAVVLVKPQFELPPALVDSGGVVTDPELHLAALEKVHRFAAEHTDFGLVGAVPSRILGTKGNREFLFYLIRGAKNAEIDMPALVTANGTSAQ